MEIAKAVLEKIGTMLVDRRLIVAIAAMIALLRMVGLVEAEVAEEDIEAMLGLFSTLFIVLAKIISVLIPLIAVIASWAKRAPSGIGRG